VDGDEVTYVGAIDTKSVTISCHDFSSSDPPASVEWYSRAWATSHDQLYIFRSDGNSDFSVESDHPNAENYVVDRQYRLTIVKVSMDNDPTIYVCRVNSSSGHQHEYKYDLIVGGTSCIFSLCSSVYITVLTRRRPEYCLYKVRNCFRSRLQVLHTGPVDLLRHTL